MSKQFTPGPWKVEYDDEYGNHAIRMGTAITNRGQYEPQHVIEYEHGCYYEEDEDEDYPANKQAREAEANTNLITAAPDMYEALSNILTLVALIDAPLDKNILSIITLCEQALAKAQGLEDKE